MRASTCAFATAGCLAVFLSAGSSSVFSRAIHERHPDMPGHRGAHAYLGVREGAASVSDSSNHLGSRTLYAIDLPLSGVVDTLLLPFDLWLAPNHADESREQQ